MTTALSARSRREHLRLAIITKLGGSCIQCGFDNALALQVDHKYGGGSAHRRGEQSYMAYYGGILDEIMRGSDKYQLLCANCNWIKRHYSHEIRKLSSNSNVEEACLGV